MANSATARSCQFLSLIQTGFVPCPLPRRSFAELKNQIGLRRLRLRRLKFVREQFFLAAAAKNIKRLVRFLHQLATPVLAATT